MFAALLFALQPMPAAQPLTLRQLAGDWRVSRLAVSQDGVQALLPDDPSYLNRRIRIAADRISWQGAADGQASTKWSCVAPSLARVTGGAATRLLAEHGDRLRELAVARPQPYRIRCRNGPWGPGESVIYAAGADTLVLPWYDGGVLKLVRERRR